MFGSIDSLSNMMPVHPVVGLLVFLSAFVLAFVFLRDRV